MGLRRAIFARFRVRPVNRSDPKTPGNLPLSAAVGQAESTARMGTGGGGATGCKRSLAGFRRSTMAGRCLMRAERGREWSREARRNLAEEKEPERMSRDVLFNDSN